MSILTTSSAATPRTDLAAPVSRIANRYGHFADDGREFIITDWRTPRPWANIIANPRLGLAVSHTGSGFTWVDNSQLAVLTRWVQDLARDASGKFLYLREPASGQSWSLSPAPMFARFDRYECRHGIGYTTFVTEHAGIRSEWTLFVDPRETVEYWRVEIVNLADRARRLELTSFLEWCCGVNPSPRREFHKLFIETAYDAGRRAVFAWNHMWEVPSREFGHWNTDFPYTAAIACSEPVLAAQGDLASFLGRYGDFRQPEALELPTWKPRFGRHEDPVAVLRSVIELPAGGRRVVVYVLAAERSRAACAALVERTCGVEPAEAALAGTRATWHELLKSPRVETPEPSLNYLVNDWCRYQAIAGRLWGRAGYYQQSGAFGFRDQLQDSQVWLPTRPEACREQINLHARHQFADGSVYHWWHPLSEQGHVTRMTDDLLWLGFVVANFVKETGDLSILADRQPFLDDATQHGIDEHVQRAFNRVFTRTSPRGLPYIGAGDWNDGLSAVGLQERGESIWLAHFLVGLLRDWAEIHRRTGRATAAEDFEARRRRLVEAINAHGWDGDWYIRGTLDSGEVFGSARNDRGRIYLNAQTWAVLNDVAPPERAAACMRSVREHLVGEMGALLLAPAYDQPVREIGYITRYAPGLRENGGVYTHAATWAIAAAAKVRDRELVGHLLRAINPALKDPERYWAEPYVLPGNCDGPTSPYPGRAGWTWYTGSAQWLHRVVTQWVLGVRPEWDGLHIEPCLPAGWTSASLTRPYRGSTYRIEIAAPASGPTTGWEVELDGRLLPGSVIPPPDGAGKQHTVRVRCL